MWELIKAFIYKVFFSADYYLLKRKEYVEKNFNNHVMDYLEKYHTCEGSPAQYLIYYTYHSEDYIDNVAYVHVGTPSYEQYIRLNFICRPEDCAFNSTPRDIHVLPIENKDMQDFITDKIKLPQESRVKEDINLGKVFTKAHNLRKRFSSVIIDFSVIGTAFMVKYKLGYEEKSFVAFYKNNNLKKKLNGAMAFKDVEANLENLVNNVNMFYSNFNSNLRLDYEYLNMEDPAGLRHFKLDICGYVIVDTSKRERLAPIYESLGTIEIEMKLKNLISEDLVKIKVGEKVYICNSKAKANEGVLEWKPIFPCSADETIYTAAVAVAEHYYRK